MATAEDDRRAMGLARAYLATRSGDFHRAEARCGRASSDGRTIPWSGRRGSIGPSPRAGSSRLVGLGFVPVRLLDSARILELRAWFARQRRDARAEQQVLEDLLTIEPGRTTTLTRLAELHQEAGHPRRAAELRRRKAELDAVLDRYFRLYKEDRYSDHLPELATMAERLGRTFEARGFWELVRNREPSNAAAPSALARLRAGTGAAIPPVSGSLARSWRPEWRPPSPTSVPPPGGGRGPIPHFEDGAPDAGLADFIQDNGSSPIHQLPECNQRWLARPRHGQRSHRRPASTISLFHDAAIVYGQPGRGPDRRHGRGRPSVPAALRWPWAGRRRPRQQRLAGCRHDRAEQTWVDLQFVRFQLEWARSNRDGVGAVVAITAGGRSRIAARFGGRSFRRPATLDSLSGSDRATGWSPSR